MSNFAQYVYTTPKEGADIKLQLSRKWDKLNSRQRTITQPDMRRTVRMDATPPVVIIEAQDQEVYAAILALGETSAVHVKRFEAMAQKGKTQRAAVKALASIAEFLKG